MPARLLRSLPNSSRFCEFRGNEVYGGSSVGFTSWELGTDGYQVPTGIQETLIKDFRVWNVYESAVWNYPSQRVTIDGLTSRADPSISLYMPGAFICGDYRNIDLTIRGGSIHGGSVFGNCVDPLGTFRFENIDAVTYGHAFNFETPSTPGTQADRPASGVTMILRNNTIRAWPGRPLQTIEMYHNTASGNNQPGDNYAVQVYNYQGQVGNNFQAYFGAQATQNIYGGLAPCNDTTTRPEVSGITCNSVAPPPPDTTPPSTPTGLSANAVSSSQITLSWIASTDDVGVTEYRLERCSGRRLHCLHSDRQPTGHRLFRHRAHGRNDLPLPGPRNRCRREPLGVLKHRQWDDTGFGSDAPIQCSELQHRRRLHEPRHYSDTRW